MSVLFTIPQTLYIPIAMSYSILLLSVYTMSVSLAALAMSYDTEYDTAYEWNITNIDLRGGDNMIIMALDVRVWNQNDC